jgi:hypothetical protein
VCGSLSSDVRVQILQGGGNGMDPERVRVAAIVRLRERQIIARTESVLYTEQADLKRQLARAGSDSDNSSGGLGGWAKGIFG